MNQKYEKFTKIVERMVNITNVSITLEWDKEVYMTSGGAKSRAREIATLESIIRDILMSDDFINALEDCESNLCDLDQWQQANLREARNLYLKEKNVNKNLLRQFVESKSMCEVIWRQAKKNNDYNLVKPYLKDVFDYARKIGEAKSQVLNCSTYDALINDYNSGLSLKDIKSSFDILKNSIPSLIADIMNKQQPFIPIDDIFDIEKQKILTTEIMKIMEFDFNRGRVDVSLHPFCTETSHETRITTRYLTNDIFAGIQGIIHETGHALYQQNLPKNYLNQFVGKPRSGSFHESQSLIMENNFTTSPGFAEFLSKKIKEIFGHSGKQYSPENIYKIMTHVQPGFIRIFADEVSYPLHIILRVEIEEAIIDGSITVDDIPHFWNEKFEQYFNIKPKNLSEGCLQDIHWFQGSIGYFPSYFFGTTIAAMLMEKALKDFPTIETEMQNVQFTTINRFLNTNLRNFGSLKTFQDLLKISTGKNSLDVEPFKRYVTKKYLP